MLFKRIKGHERTISKLAEMCVDGSFSGPYLFKGPEAVGKYTIARLLSKYLICLCEELDPGCRCGSCRIFPRSPDYLDIDRGKDIIKVEDVAPVEEYASLSPFKSKKKVVVINNAENMNSAAANRLLKLFETDRKHVVYFLISSNPDKLLQTVVSRCRVISFEGLDPEHISSILSKVNVSENDITFLRNIRHYVHGGILSDYNKYLTLAKQIPPFIKAMSGKDEGNLLIKIDEVTEKGELVHFLELLTIYVGDILKMHYDSVDTVSFYRDLDSLEQATEKMSDEICLAFISRIQKCLEVHNKGLNLKIQSNVKSAVSWVFMLASKGKK